VKRLIDPSVQASVRSVVVKYSTGNWVKY